MAELVLENIIAHIKKKSGEKYEPPKDFSFNECLELAIYRNNTDAVKLLLKLPWDYSKNTIFHSFLQIIINKLENHMNKQEERESLRECFIEFILRKVGKENVNYIFKEKRLLYYVVRYGSPKATLSLLDEGASLNAKNNDGTLNLTNMNYLTLKYHLDNCLERSLDDNDEEIITLNYTTLLNDGISTYSQSKGDDTVIDINVQKNNVGELDALLYISQQNRLDALVTHPLIVNYIKVKWNTLQWMFYIRFAIYFVFCLSLVLYVCLSYLVAKDINGYFYFLSVMAGMVALREICELFSNAKIYLLNVRNYFEMALLGLVVAMLCTTKSSKNVKDQLSAVAVLLCGFELLFLFGTIPECSIYIAMLRKVSLSFFKFFAFYFSLLLAFAYAFFILFEVQVDSNEWTDYAMAAFDAIFKTILQFIGEFGDLDFDKYNVTNRLMFLVFVFVVSLVLVNLVNGLAIADIQEVRQEAELLVCKAAVYHLYCIENFYQTVKKYFETMGNDFKILVWPDKNYKMCCNVTVDKSNKTSENCCCNKRMSAQTADKIECWLKDRQEQLVAEKEKLDQDDKLLQDIKKILLKSAVIQSSKET